MDLEAQEKQSLIITRADAQLAEREKNKILQELETIQGTKEVAFREIAQQKENAQKEVMALKGEGLRLQGLVRLYTEAIEGFIQERDLAEKAALTQKTRAIEEVKGIYSDADRRERVVMDREENVSKKEAELAKCEDIIKGREGAVIVIESQIEERAQLIMAREKGLSIREADSNLRLEKTRRLLDDIERQLKEKRIEMESLDTTIRNKTMIAEQTGIEAQSKLKEASLLIKELAAQKETQDEKDKKLNQKELWLNDREATVGRAYNEVISRGGRVE
jgi:hypothetical protein